jgi:hypothetical protein
LGNGGEPASSAEPLSLCGIGAAFCPCDRTGRPEQASSDLERLAALQKTLADAKNLYWARQVSIQLKMASAWVDHALGRDADAVALMQDAAKTEETSETRYAQSRSDRHDRA